MDNVTIHFSWLDEERNSDLPLPNYETELSAGMDVAAAIEEDVVLGKGERTLIPCGFSIAIPVGFEVQVRPRSGLAIKHGITIINAPGTIDADYRGEVKVAVVNLSEESFTISRGDRIAQLVLAPVCKAELKVVAELEETLRGSGGFGHTGLR